MKELAVELAAKRLVRRGKPVPDDFGQTFNFSKAWAPRGSRRASDGAHLALVSTRLRAHARSASARPPGGRSGRVRIALSGRWSRFCFSHRPRTSASERRGVIAGSLAGLSVESGAMIAAKKCAFEDTGRAQGIAVRVVGHGRVNLVDCRRQPAPTPPSRSLPRRTALLSSGAHATQVPT
jgi:hypothetical protein